MSASDPPTTFFYTISGKRYGPVSFPHLRRLASEDILKRSDKVWSKGMPGWQEAGLCEGLFTDLPPELRPEPDLKIRGQSHAADAIPERVPPGIARHTPSDHTHNSICEPPGAKVSPTSGFSEGLRKTDTDASAGCPSATARMDSIDPPKRAPYATTAAFFGILSPFGWLMGIIAAFIYTLTADQSGGVWEFRMILAVFSIAPPLLAVATGRAAQRRIRESGGTLSGKWQARTGLILGYGTLIVLLILFLLAVCYVEQLDEYFSKPVDDHYP